MGPAGHAELKSLLPCRFIGSARAVSVTFTAQILNVLLTGKAVSPSR
jgi:hypothetical protein